MGKNDRDVVARRELTHALEALGDGIGHDKWGPGPVIERLSKRQFDYPGVGMAIDALEAATMASHDLLHRTKREDALIAIRRLAPVFLELIIEKDGAESVKRNVWSALEGATYRPAMTATEMGELMKATAFMTPPEPPASFTAAAARAAVITRDMFLGAALPQQKLVDDAKRAVCVGCGVKCGIEYPNEPTVGRRPDGVIRCNDCEAQFAALPPAICDSCGMTEASGRTLALRKDGVLRCDSCSNELEDALARGCECPGCRSVRAKRGAPLTGSLISSSANG